MTNWEPPYDNVLLEPEDILNIINTVKGMENAKTVKLEFE